MNDNNSLEGDIQNREYVSVVIPAFNEEKGIEHTIEEINNILATCNIRYEIIVVDDGSGDKTYDRVNQLCKNYPALVGIKFSRNFGKEAAILAGLQAAKGQAVITIDADLQHPPSIIPDMIARWREGVKVVHAVKRSRDTDNIITRFRANVFNSLVKMLGNVDIRNSSDYKLLDRVAVNVIVRQLKEHKRFYRGLAKWVGFRQESIYFDVLSRYAGESQWSIKALIGLAITGIISFTSLPLRIVTVLGFITLLLALIIAIDTLWSWAMGTAVSGFATIIITLLLIGSFIMISLGIMGEYIAKIYDEIKSRPNYLIDETCGDSGEKGHE